ncbi:MAG: c-type cytochrome [Nitrospinales bacterium]
MNNQNNKFRRLLVQLIMLAVFCLPASVYSAQMPDPIQKDKLEAGKKVYFKRCIWCHGVEGGGDGPSHDRLFTKPRNFIQGTFKIRSTDSGELPLDADLLKTVRNGLPGSAMPAWGEFLSDSEIEAVIQFVKSKVQDREFDDEDEELTVQDFGTSPWNTTGPHHLGVPDDAIAKGKEVFIKNKCFECHGGEGRGDGNPTMKDDWGFPIVAADWQQCWNFRGSRRDPYNPFNIVRTITTGLNGTPMPNFREQITMEDRWNIAAFVNSLCPRKNIDKLTNKPVPDFLIRSTYTVGSVATKIDDPMWQVLDDDARIKPRAEGDTSVINAHYIAMAGQITRGNRNFRPKVDNLWVSSRWSEEDQAVFYLVEYHNRFLSTDPEYPDAVGIEWPGKLQDLFGAEKPYFIYGDAKKQVDIWKAEVMPKDYNPTNAPNPAGYQLDAKVTELIGKGFDNVETKENTTVEIVDSIYKQGRVKVLFKRSLNTEGEDDVQIPVKSFIPVAFMQWAGINQEKDEHMAISTWYYTILEPSLPASIYYMPPIMAGVFVIFQGWLVWMTKRTRRMFDEGKMRRDIIPD